MIPGKIQETGMSVQELTNSIGSKAAGEDNKPILRMSNYPR